MFLMHVAHIMAYLRVHWPIQNKDEYFNELILKRKKIAAVTLMKKIAHHGGGEGSNAGVRYLAIFRGGERRNTKTMAGERSFKPPPPS